jgi:hypothetical protein
MRPGRHTSLTVLPEPGRGRIRLWSLALHPHSVVLWGKGQSGRGDGWFAASDDGCECVRRAWGEGGVDGDLVVLLVVDQFQAERGDQPCLDGGRAASREPERIPGHRGQGHGPAPGRRLRRQPRPVGQLRLRQPTHTPRTAAATLSPGEPSPRATRHRQRPAPATRAGHPVTTGDPRHGHAVSVPVCPACLHHHLPGQRDNSLSGETHSDRTPGAEGMRILCDRCWGFD